MKPIFVCSLFIIFIANVVRANQRIDILCDESKENHQHPHKHVNPNKNRPVSTPLRNIILNSNESPINSNKSPETYYLPVDRLLDGSVPSGESYETTVRYISEKPKTYIPIQPHTINDKRQRRPENVKHPIPEEIKPEKNILRSEPNEKQQQYFVQKSKPIKKQPTAKNTKSTYYEVHYSNQPPKNLLPNKYRFFKRPTNFQPMEQLQTKIPKLRPVKYENLQPQPVFRTTEVKHIKYPPSEVKNPLENLPNMKKIAENFPKIHPSSVIPKFSEYELPQRPRYQPPNINKIIRLVSSKYPKEYIPVTTSLPIIMNDARQYIAPKVHQIVTPPNFDVYDYNLPSKFIPFYPDYEMNGNDYLSSSSEESTEIDYPQDNPIQKLIPHISFKESSYVYEPPIYETPSPLYSPPNPINQYYSEMPPQKEEIIQPIQQQELPKPSLARESVTRDDPSPPYVEKQKNTKPLSNTQPISTPKLMKKVMTRITNPVQYIPVHKIEHKKAPPVYESGPPRQINGEIRIPIDCTDIPENASQFFDTFNSESKLHSPIYPQKIAHAILKDFESLPNFQLFNNDGLKTMHPLRLIALLKILFEGLRNVITVLKNSTPNYDDLIQDAVTAFINWFQYN